MSDQGKEFKKKKGGFQKIRIAKEKAQPQFDDDEAFPRGPIGADTFSQIRSEERVRMTAKRSRGVQRIQRPRSESEGHTLGHHIPPPPKASEEKKRDPDFCPVDLSDTKSSDKSRGPSVTRELAHEIAGFSGLGLEAGSQSPPQVRSTRRSSRKDSPVGAQKIKIPGALEGPRKKPTAQRETSEPQDSSETQDADSRPQRPETNPPPVQKITVFTSEVPTQGVSGSEVVPIEDRGEIHKLFHKILPPHMQTSLKDEKSEISTIVDTFQSLIDASPSEVRWTPVVCGKTTGRTLGIHCGTLLHLDCRIQVDLKEVKGDSPVRVYFTGAERSPALEPSQHATIHVIAGEVKSYLGVLGFDAKGVYVQLMNPEKEALNGGGELKFSDLKGQKVTIHFTAIFTLQETE